MQCMRLYEKRLGASESTAVEAGLHQRASVEQSHYVQGTSSHPLVSRVQKRDQDLDVLGRSLFATGAKVRCPPLVHTKMRTNGQC